MSETVALTFGTASIFGGLYGYHLKRSKPSLLAGVGVGSLYLTSAYLMHQQKLSGTALAFGTSGLLFGAIIPRAISIKKGPPVVLAVMSFTGLAYFGYKYQEEKFQ
ncbi:transmembrane proteins 14C-domain-containing protein [Globomyces pollinis-pini]|nr:transmembrane proteins 14C-domain-containing protein [Globomyces pollinis-pini]